MGGRMSGGGYRRNIYRIVTGDGRRHSLLAGLQGQEYVLRLFELLQTPELRLADHPGNIALFQQAAINPEDHYLRELVEQVVENQIAEWVTSGDPFFGNYPPKGSLTLPRGILVGVMPTGDPIVLPFGANAGHLGIHGPTRKGKSSLLRFTVPQLVRLGACVVLMTHKPREFASLMGLRALRELSQLLYCYEMMLALTEPAPGVPKDKWAVDLVDLLARNYSLFASRRLLLGSLNNLYDKSPLESINLERWCNYLRGFETGRGLREQGYKESGWWTLQTLYISTGGKEGIFAYSRSNFLEKLFSRPGLTVIEGQSLPPEHFSFLSTYMVRWLYMKRLYGGQ